MTTREYLDADFHKCVKLFTNVFNAEPWNDKWSLTLAEQYLNDYINTPGFSGIVYDDDTEIKGFLFGTRKRWWSGNEFFINEMCVENDNQRRGIGTEILNFLENFLKREGIIRITLLTNKGIPAEAFYKKNGFKEIESLRFLNKELRVSV